MYNPVPPKVWYRVQNSCYLTTQPITSYEYTKQMLLKGNILQYKKNSSNLTNSQKYSLIARGQWVSRGKTYATQSEKYTNPNTTSLLRVNGTSVVAPPTFPNPNQDICPTNIYQDGGNLICNTTVNPCTGEVIKKTTNKICYPSSDSDVPGKITNLCWDNRLQTWYPKQRYIMNTTTDKWPEGYKGFVSALKPYPPVLSGEQLYGENSISLTWTFEDNVCIPTTNFLVYQNGVIIQNVLIPNTTTTINNLVTNDIYNYYVTSVSSGIESMPSNIVTIQVFDYI